MSTNQDELFRLVELFATSEQVKQLLRLAKDHEAVRITAENKSDLIQRNLRSAVASKAITLDQVYGLVREAEENGGQHIFYFKPRNKTVAESMAFESVAKQLWGTDWQKKMSFPNVKTAKNHFVYGDFRLWNPTKKPLDWMLKLYGHMQFERFTGEEKQEDGGLWRLFVPEDLRIVLIARWNSPDLLELRVQRDQSRKRINSWLAEIWKMLGPALDKGNIDAWDLSKARRRMIDEEQKNQHIYQFRDTRLEDSVSNRMSFESHATQGNLFASTEAKQAINDVLAAKNSRCTHLSVNWLPTKDGTLSREYRTLLGDREAHEVIFSAQCSAAEVDYVTDKLRYFSR
ncbi:MAG: hypothetical protein ABSG52_14960 [Terriglobales bacterium]|jgi:hypothetical protein